MNRLKFLLIAVSIVTAGVVFAPSQTIINGERIVERLTVGNTSPGVLSISSGTYAGCDANTFTITANSTTAKLQKCENGTVTDIGGGGGATRRTLFKILSGQGTTTGNYSSSVLPFGCLSNTVGVVGGSGAHQGNLQFQDTTGEYLDCRVGVIPFDVDISSFRVEIAFNQQTNETNTYTMDLEWRCDGSGVDISTSTWYPSTPVAMSVAGNATSSGFGNMKIMVHDSIDLTQDSSGCAVGEFLWLKFTRDSGDTATGEIRAFSLEGWSYN